jgi:proteasome lid subunit RPN8/RPN11
MRKAGVAESVIMSITGHSTREMFDRYNAIDEKDAHDALKRLESFLGNVDQSVDQVQNSKQATAIIMHQSTNYPPYPSIFPNKRGLQALWPVNPLIFW